GRIREDLAAAAPQRTVRLAGARTAGALLRPGLLVRLVDVGGAPLLAGVAACVGLVCGHQLMNQRFVVLAAEQRVGSGVRRRGLAVVVDKFQIHVQAPFFSGALAAG